MLKPVLSFDVDGTLVDPQDQLHPADLAILANPPEGAILVPNTGRPLQALKRLFRKHGIYSNGTPVPFPMVLQNGGVFYRPGEELIGAEFFDLDTQNQILAILADYPQVTTLLTAEDDIYAMHPTPFAEQASHRFDFRTLPFEQWNPSMPLVKLMIISDRLDEMQELLRRSQGLRAVVTSSMPIIIEYNPQGVDKATGLKRLLNELQIDGAPIYVAGDGGNDRSVLAAADYSFAPATCPEEIQACVNEVVDVAREGILTPMLRAAGVWG